MLNSGYDFIANSCATFLLLNKAVSMSPTERQ